MGSPTSHVRLSFAGAAGFGRQCRLRAGRIMGAGAKADAALGVRRLGKRLVGVETSVAKELARPAPKQRTAPAPWRRAEARGQKILPIRAIRLARGSAPWEKSRDCQAAGQLLGLYSISRPTSSAPRQRRSRTRPALQPAGTCRRQQLWWAGGGSGRPAGQSEATVPGGGRWAASLGGGSGRELQCLSLDFAIKHKPSQQRLSYATG